MYEFVTISPESLTIRHNPSGKVVKSKLQIEIIPCITVYNADTQILNLVKSIGMTGFLCFEFKILDLDTKLDKLFQYSGTLLQIIWHSGGFVVFSGIFPTFSLFFAYI